MKFNALVYLTVQRLPGRTVCRVERSIVAIGAATPACRAVPVRTCEACINDYLLEPFAISLSEMPCK